MNEPTTTKARELRERALNAEGTRDREREALYRPDGSKRYGEDEHAERQGTIAESYREALVGVADEAEREAKAAESELAALEHGDPPDLLRADELERAGAKRIFVSEDVEGLRDKDLAGRLRAVLAGGDRASAFCYLQAAERRVRGMDVTPAGASEALDELRDYLQGDSRRRQMAETGLRVEEAREVGGLAQALRRGGRNAGEVYALESYGDVAERLAAAGR
jgi:hypothetical protein